MTTVTTVARIYIPSPGQADAATRASALGAALADTSLATEPRYVARATSLPCVVLDRGHEIAVISDNPQTTHAAVDAAQDAMLADDIPTTISRTSDVTTSLTSAVTAHSVAANPHGITPAAIGAAAASHAHVDADIPAAIARDAEVAAAVSTHEAASDPHSVYLTPTEGDARYALAGGGVTGGALRVVNPQTATATAATAVTGMSFAVAANATYVFQMHLSVTTSTGTAPTTTWGFTGPASPTAVAVVAEIDTSTSVETSATIVAFGSFAAGAQVASTGAKFHGVIQTAATAGTVQLTVARGGTTPSMVIAAGSNGFWLRVA